ncbi:MAG TPA: FecR domain-containing protein, partial [Thermoanaerobaculia bacterium]
MKATQQNWTRRATGTLLAFGLVALMSASPVQAQQQRDEYGDVSAADVGYQTVARISYLSGNVSFARGDDPDNWQAADQNVPMSVGDRIYTDAKSRVELESDGGDVIRVGARSELSALNLTGDTKQFAVKSGIVSFHVGNIGDNDVFEVDTPNSAITFQQGGDYRVEVDDSGNSRV